MSTPLPPLPQLERPHLTQLTPPDTEQTELEFLREQNQQLRDLVVQLSRLVVKHLVEK